jgi:dimethylargininase
MLHLKSGLAYLEDNVLLVTGEFINNLEFKKFNKIIIDEEETYSTNCIKVNNYVLVPAGYPKTKEKIKAAGFKVIAVDTSEHRKVNGGLSCLSLRF